MTTFENQRKSESDWFFDSGATSHMCSSKAFLLNVQETSQRVSVANDAELSVVATGSVELEADIGGESCDLTMSDVLCVPDIAINLLSVSRMCSKGYSVQFTKDACEVRSNSGELVAVGQETSGLFKLCLTNKQMSCAAKSKDDIILWHRRMGHLNEQSLMKLRRLADGIDFGNAKIPACVTCLEGKHFRQPFNNEGTRATEVLELVHSDLCGPMEEESIGGSRYFLSFIDDASRKLVVYFLQSKTEVLECFKEYKALMENQTGKRIKGLRTDNGTEYVNTSMKRFLRSCGIRHELTVPYNPEQNGLAERMNRTVVEKARCLLLDADLDKTFWAEATAMAAFLINRSPTKGVSVTPEERFTGKRPDLSELKVFGAKVMCYIPKQRRRKWDAKSEPGIFVGFAYQSKGYRVYLPKTKTMKVVRDAVFLSEEEQRSVESPEAVLPKSRTMTNEIIFGNESGAGGVDRTEETSETSDEDSSEPEDVSEASDGDGSEPEDVADADDDDGPGPLYVSASESLEPTSAETIALPSQSVDPLAIRRSERERNIPGKYQDYDMTYSVIPKRLSVSQESSKEPQSFQEAMESDEKQLWQRAMEAEFEALMSNNTWELTDLPPGRKALKCKWVLKKKMNSDGSLDRHKARVVIKGFSQVKGIDYNETYSPVVRYASIRYLMGMAAQLDLQIHQMDAVTAFLQGELADEEIFMEQPEGFVQKDPRKVCRLKKALYGLKQASRVWNAKLDTELKRIGFRRSSYDPCVYLMSDGKRIIIVAVYVDDLLLFSNAPKWLDAVKGQLSARFRMKDLGEAHQVLGMRITRNGGTIVLDQQRYIEELLQKYNMVDCNPTSTPAEVSQRLVKAMSPKTEQEKARMQNVPYRELVGGLLFLSQCTRPDIAYAVNAVSSFCSNPGEAHWTAAKRILRYLQGTKSFGLVFQKMANPVLEGFSDADWGNDPDSRRSVTGYLFQFGGGSVSWSSRKQPTVALSTMEAEYMALSAASQEALWWRGFCAELLGRKVPIVIHCDNRSAMCLAEKEIGYSPRSKHIDVRHHFVREQLENHTMQLKYIRSGDQKADALTKAVPGQFKSVFGISQILS